MMRESAARLRLSSRGLAGPGRSLVRRALNVALMAAIATGVWEAEATPRPTTPRSLARASDGVAA